MTAAARRILIVEDQRLIAADLESTLKKLGYQVVANAAEGEDAIEKALALNPTLVLMDIRLRGPMDGIRAAETIRSRIDIPIVYLTAYADEETILRAKVTSPFGYVVKPFNERELRAAIEIAIYRHETERLLAEERARRAAAEEFKLFVDSVRDYSIIMLDASGCVSSWNEGARRIKGYAAAEILGRHFSTFYTPEDVSAGVPARALENALRDGRAELEGWRVRKDGSRFWANVILTAIRDADARFHAFGIVTRDLSERKRAEQYRDQLIAELEDAVRARDSFLQIASHELKTPLAPLQIQLDAIHRSLARADVLDDRIAAKLDTAIRQTVRLTRLVDSLLDVSRISSGHVQLDLEVLDIATLVHDVTDRFRAEAAATGSELVVHADEAIVGAWDRLRVEQIICNLLSNAIKYGLGKSIEVDVHAADPNVDISVTDHGIGIDDDALDRIFHQFERAVSVRHFGGLGLGLYIARQFAEAHGGSIVARSSAGAGSTFTVLLPLRIERSLAAQPGRPA